MINSEKSFIGIEEEKKKLEEKENDINRRNKQL